MKTMLKIAIIAISITFSEAEVRHYTIHRDESYVYVGIGWRVGYQVEGRFSNSNFELDPSIFFDSMNNEINPRTKFAGIRGGAGIREFATLLQRCKDAVDKKSEFKGKFDIVTIHYIPKVKNIMIMVGDSEISPFISATIPANEIVEFSDTVTQIANDYEEINKKLKAQQAAPRNR